MPLRLQNISKAFGDKKVLDGFSMEVEEKGRVCILGPSGGGKTTLLRIIAGLILPDSGEMERPQGRISYIFQEDRLMPWLTVEDNITAVTNCSRETAREMLAAMELNGEERSYPDALSGGMKQRVNIARALAFPSSLMLMDEPFKGLDAGLRERVIARIDQCCAHQTVVLVTHDRAECDLMRCTQSTQIIQM